MPMQGFAAWALAGLIAATTPAAWLVAAAGEDDPPTLTAEQIVEKNVAARGGLDAWRKVQTMVWTGHIQNGNPAAPIEAFIFELKRPNKTRFEITADHQKTLRVFDGVAGWKARTAATGAPTLRPYSPLELRSAHDAQGLDGLLIDHQAKGIKVGLDGADDIEGRRAYRLTVTLPSGSMRHVWIDAQTFLELKYDRESHAAAGRSVTVSVFYRNFRAIDGLQMPMTIEAEAGAGRVTEKMTIDDVTLNPTLSDAHFEKPNAPHGRDALPGVHSEFSSAHRPFMDHILLSLNMARSAMALY
jgi:hypothetical protein